MRRLVIIVLIIAGVGFLFSKSFHQDTPATTVQNPAVTTTTSVAGPDHAALTNMALQSEAKARQAAAIAATDPVADFEKTQAEQ